MVSAENANSISFIIVVNIIIDMTIAKIIGIITISNMIITNVADLIIKINNFTNKMSIAKITSMTVVNTTVNINIIRIINIIIRNIMFDKIPNIIDHIIVMNPVAITVITITVNAA